MRIKDLMIGDWVQIDAIKGADLVAVKRKVAGITNVKLATVTIDDGVEVFAAFLFPVPLTTEMLEKNGFKNTLGVTLYSLYGDDYSIYMSCAENDSGKKWKITIENIIAKGTYTTPFDEEETWTCVNAIKMYINYVHELQHALKLCGIEKEIEL